ncbi:MAG: GGDEF domain-containing protein [Pseudomonadota bacterium]
MGGDEFAILVQGAEPSAIPMAESVAEKVLAAIGQPMWLDGREGREAHLSASMGIAACPEHVCEEGGLMRLADQAMYQAKAGGRGAGWSVPPVAWRPSASAEPCLRRWPLRAVVVPGSPARRRRCPGSWHRSRS